MYEMIDFKTQERHNQERHDKHGTTKTARNNNVGITFQGQRNFRMWSSVNLLLSTRRIKIQKTTFENLLILKSYSLFFFRIACRICSCRSFVPLLFVPSVRAVMCMPKKFSKIFFWKYLSR